MKDDISELKQNLLNKTKALADAKDKVKSLKEAFEKAKKELKDAKGIISQNSDMLKHSETSRLKLKQERDMLIMQRKKLESRLAFFERFEVSDLCNLLSGSEYYLKHRSLFEIQPGKTKVIVPIIRGKKIYRAKVLVVAEKEGCLYGILISKSNARGWYVYFDKNFSYIITGFWNRISYRLKIWSSELKKIKEGIQSKRSEVN